MGYNPQNQDYSPQIPDLTPAAMKNEGVLRRLVNHLRSLTIFAGEGIKINRQGYGTTISVDTIASGGAGEAIPDRGEPYFWYNDGKIYINNMFLPNGAFIQQLTPLAIGDVALQKIYINWEQSGGAFDDAYYPEIATVESGGRAIYVGEIKIAAGVLTVIEDRLRFGWMFRPIGERGIISIAGADGIQHRLDFENGILVDYNATV